MSSSLLFTAWLGLFVGQITTATTTTAPPAESKVMLEFKIQQTFTVTPELANTSPAAIQTLATQVVSAMDNVYRARFFNFNRNVVKGFSLGSFKVEAELIFNGIAAPNATSVVDALVEAAHSYNISFPPVNPSSIVATASTTTAPPAESKVMLEFKIQQTFSVTPELANTIPAAIQTLATQVVSAMDNVYKSTFSDFNHTVVKSFSLGSVKVEAELIFNGIAAPNATSVVDALVEAASSSNFSFPVNPSSIVATVTSPQTQAATASALLTTINTNSGNATSPPVIQTLPRLNATSPTVHTTSLPVTAATTPVVFPPTQAPTTAAPLTTITTNTPAGNTASPPVIPTLPRPRLNATSPTVHTTSLPVTAATTPVVLPPTQAPTTAAPLTTITTNTPAGNAASPPVIPTLPRLNATSPTVHATSLPVTAATTPVVLPSTQAPTTAAPLTTITMNTPAGNATSPPVNATSPPVNATSLPELTIFAPAQVKMISSYGELTEDEIASHIDKFFKQISGNAFGPFKVTVKRINKQKKIGT